MKAIAEHKYVTIYGPFPLEFLKVLIKCTGRKIWTQAKSVRVEGSGWNIKILKESGFPIEWDDKTNDLKELDELQHLISKVVEPIKHNYHPKLPLKKHQNDSLNVSCFRHAFAYFMEMGLGKTATAIANFSILYLENKLSGVLILAPKGVHKQWIAEEIPKHIDPEIQLNMTLWTTGKYYESSELKINGVLNIFAMNIDAINTDSGGFAVNQFLNLFKNKVMIIIDESHQIGNYGSQRTKMAIELGKLGTYRRILTGTPIATNLENIWCQFMFLDPRIIGINYITPFKARFCDTNTYSGEEEAKNVEEFYTLIAPHSFRITKKECLDLPEKIYENVPYSLGAETKKHYENMKFAFMTELKSGAIVDAPNALAAMTRLQQICSGFLPETTEDLFGFSKRVHELFSYERAEIALDIVNQVEGPVIIWARFIEDIKSLKHVFYKKHRDEIATYEDRDDFRTGKKRFLFMNQSRGVGMNLQESGCEVEIFYNNTFNLIHRVQSEDRVHRMGMKGALTIFDIVAEKTIDRAIAENLKAKKDLASFVLDEIRQMIE
jgi:Mesyanzhinovviridae DNA helicase